MTARSGTPAPRVRGDDGMVGGLEVLPFGVLTFVVGALLVANAWAVVDARYLATNAAREAVRTYVEAPEEASALGHARRAASEVATAHGRDPNDVTIELAHQDGTSWSRCTRVSATVRLAVPALQLPWIGGFGTAFDVESRHSEIVDPFRSGVPGIARCR